MLTRLTRSSGGFMQRILCLIVLGVVAASCTTIRPYQRERLAAPTMISPFSDDRAAGGEKDRVVESKTGGGLGGAAVGGGCGCTQ
jgi:hypothetical protein